MAKIQIQISTISNIPNGGSKNSMKESTSSRTISPGRSNIRITSLQLHLGSFEPIAPTVVSKSKFRAGINRRSHLAASRRANDNVRYSWIG